jgi:hypothetical protein
VGHPIVLDNYKWYHTKFSESLSIKMDEKVFQNPQIFRKTLRLFPEQSTLAHAGPAKLPQARYSATKSKLGRKSYNLNVNITPSVI